MEFIYGFTNANMTKDDFVMPVLIWEVSQKDDI